MSRLRAPAISALLALLGLALPVQAAPAPIVFDFEDGASLSIGVDDGLPC